MLVGTLQVELLLHATFSLKEKRYILRSIKQRIKNDFNVSIAEVGYQDKWQRALLGVACVGNEKRFLNETLAKVLNVIDRDDRIEIIDQLMEID